MSSSVPPPHTVSSLRACICNIEDIKEDPSSISTFISRTTQPVSNDKLTLALTTSPGPGSKPEDPIALLLKSSSHHNNHTDNTDNNNNNNNNTETYKNYGTYSPDSFTDTSSDTATLRPSPQTRRLTLGGRLTPKPKYSTFILSFFEFLHRPPPPYLSILSHIQT